VTDAPRQHAHYDELAAGYALDALDSEDERQFRSHLPTCPRCQEALSDFTEVAAALADDRSTVEPSPRLGARIRAAIAQEPAGGAAQTPQAPAAHAPHQAPAAHGQPRADRPRGGDGDRPPAGVTDLSQRRRRRRLTTAVGSAAAAILVAGGAIWGGLAASGGAPLPPSASCIRAHACREVQLTDARSHAPAAKVVIADGTAWLIPSGLPADDTSRQVYVLWQITGAHTPLAVGSFDVASHGDKPVRVGQLTVPYQGTWAFAVSIEHGRTIPATPSHPVALGQVQS
jgi:Putative zinc-finger